MHATLGRFRHNGRVPYARAQCTVLSTECFYVHFVVFFVRAIAALRKKTKEKAGEMTEAKAKDDEEFKALQDDLFRIRMLAIVRDSRPRPIRCHKQETKKDMILKEGATFLAQQYRVANLPSHADYFSWTKPSCRGKNANNVQHVSHVGKRNVAKIKGNGCLFTSKLLA